MSKNTQNTEGEKFKIPQIIKKPIVDSSDKIRQAISSVINSSDFNDEDKTEWLDKIIDNLDDNNELLSRKISDILIERKIKYIEEAFQDKITWLPNKLSLQYDIEQNNCNQLLILIQIKWLEDLNNVYWYKWTNDIIKDIWEAINQYFGKHWFKLYKHTWSSFWLLKTIWNDFDISQLLQKLDENIFQMDIKTQKYWEIRVNNQIWVGIWKNEQLKKSQIALKKASENDDIVVYTSELREEYENKDLEKIKYVNEVQNALKEWRIVPFFQWIRDNKTWKITKYESLVRIKKWDVIISPFLFLKHIEWTSIMKELTRTMINKVIEKMNGNSNTFSINLTECDINDSSIISLIKEKLSKEWIKPSRLIIEILEESKWGDEWFYQAIENMKNIWVEIAIDDFWTWYSWFNRVYETSPEYLKIDWSLIKWIAKDERKRKLVKSITTFAQAMWSKVVAEFIEDEETQKIIDSIWVDYSQWYLYSEPSEKIEI